MVIVRVKPDTVTPFGEMLKPVERAGSHHD